MVSGGSGASGGRDLSRIIAKSEHSMDEIDFKKGVRKAKRQAVHEQSMDGVTEESIAEYVKATRAAKHAARNPVTFDERVRRFFRRG